MDGNHAEYISARKSRAARGIRNVNEKSVTEVEGALRDFARDGGVIRRDPKDATDFVANVDLLAQRAASLVELRSVIR
jgi:hypothetical protein